MTTCEHFVGFVRARRARTQTSGIEICRGRPRPADAILAARMPLSVDPFKGSSRLDSNLDADGDGTISAEEWEAERATRGCHTANGTSAGPAKNAFDGGLSCSRRVARGVLVLNA